MSRIQNLDDLPTQVSYHFYVNASRLHHVLFNDVTKKYNRIQTSIDLVLEHIQQNNVDKRGKQKGFLTLEPKTSLLNFINSLS